MVNFRKTNDRAHGDGLRWRQSASYRASPIRPPGRRQHFVGVAVDLHAAPDPCNPPSAPISTVVLMMPRKVLPYIDFRPRRHRHRAFRASHSETSGISSRCLLRKASCALSESAETPSTVVPLSAKALASRVKSIASLVQPGVSARG